MRCLLYSRFTCWSVRNYMPTIGTSSHLIVDPCAFQSSYDRLRWLSINSTRGQSVTERSRDSRDVATVHRRRGRRRRQEDVVIAATARGRRAGHRTAPANVSSTVDSTSTGHFNGDDSETQSFG